MTTIKTFFDCPQCHQTHDYDWIFQKSTFSEIIQDRCSVETICHHCRYVSRHDLMLDINVQVLDSEVLHLGHPED
jgi:hypothetical protein